MEYIQKRYKYADVPFPERSSYTINITSDMANTSSNMNMNIANMMKTAHTQSCQSEHLLCPGCGRMTFCQNKSNMQALSQNEQNVQIEENQQQGQYMQNMTEVQQKEMICPECQNCSKCPGCGRMTYSENKSNIQTMSQNVEVNVQNQNVQNSENEQLEQQEQQEQNVAVQQDECICPDCKKTEIATD